MYQQIIGNNFVLFGLTMTLTVFNYMEEVRTTKNVR